jgi:hypothetical protein
MDEARVARLQRIAMLVVGLINAGVPFMTRIDRLDLVDRAYTLDNDIYYKDVEQYN